jgi:hypothetical protein
MTKATFPATLEAVALDWNLPVILDQAIAEAPG